MNRHEYKASPDTQCTVETEEEEEYEASCVLKAFPGFTNL